MPLKVKTPTDTFNFQIAFVVSLDTIGPRYNGKIIKTTAEQPSTPLPEPWSGAAVSVWCCRF